MRFSVLCGFQIEIFGPKKALNEVSLYILFLIFRVLLVEVSNYNDENMVHRYTNPLSSNFLGLAFFYVST